MRYTKGPWYVANDSCNPLTGTSMPSVGPIGETVAAVEKWEDAILIAASPRMRDALWAIANMQVKPETNHAQLSALCISIAKIALAEVEGMKSTNE